MPPGITPKTFVIPGAGVTVTLPATWQVQPPTSGFQYRAGDSAGAFLLAGSFTPRPGATVSSAGAARAKYLRSIGAKIASRTTTTVDEHGAARLSYRLSPSDRPAVDDIEYDIAR